MEERDREKLTKIEIQLEAIKVNTYKSEASLSSLSYQIDELKEQLREIQKSISYYASSNTYDGNSLSSQRGASYLQNIALFALPVIIGLLIIIVFKI